MTIFRLVADLQILKWLASLGKVEMDAAPDSTIHERGVGHGMGNEELG